MEGNINEDTSAVVWHQLPMTKAKPLLLLIVFTFDDFTAVRQ
jgi:hypothetical protein